MEANVTIPAEVKLEMVHEFRFNPQSKVALVMLKESAEGDQYALEVDFSALVAAATTTQKTTLKQFFKRVAALAFTAASSVTVNDTDVTGEFFDDV